MNRITLFYACLTVLWLLTAGSCTVEKRLYNKGWHVSTNRYWKNNRSEKERQQLLSDRETIATETVMPAVLAPQEQALMTEAPVISDTVANAVSAETTAPIAHAATLPGAEQLKAIPADNNEVAQKTEQKPGDPSARWSRREKTATALFMVGVILACIVLMILLLSAGTFAAGASVAETIMIGVALFVVALLAAILFFIILTIPSREELEERAREREKEEKDREEELGELEPEEREEILREEEAVTAKKKQTRTVVLSILGILFAAAAVIPFLL